jgi:trehalose-phosphatase
VGREPGFADVAEEADPSSLVPQSWPAFADAPWWQRVEGTRSVLMLDYDGTLAPFVRERMHAKPYIGVSQRLLRLASAPLLRLVLISGRPARELASLLPLSLKVEIWGSHGRERLNPDGGYAGVSLRPRQQQCLKQLEAALEREGFAWVVERKIGSLAIHTRGLHQEQSRYVIDLARDFYCSVADNEEDPDLEWLPFDGGIELRGVGYTKATAVHSILRDEPPRTPAAYLGDDQTDEDAFAALRERQPRNLSLSVLVRSELRPSAADLWLIPPTELLAFLDRWLMAVGQPTGAR